MKTLILTISFIFFSLTTSFSQWRAIDRPDNDKIINYILQGKYKKVIKLTKSAHFNRVSFLDTNSATFLLYSRDTHYLDSLSDSLFISYMQRITRVINSSNISNALCNPKDLDINISTSAYDDATLGIIDIPNAVHNRRIYTIIDKTYQYSIILTFINFKFTGLSIQICKLQ